MNKISFYKSKTLSDYLWRLSLGKIYYAKRWRMGGYILPPETYKEFYGLFIVYTFAPLDFLASISYEEEKKLRLLIESCYAKYGWTITEYEIIPFTMSFPIDNPKRLYSCMYKNHYVKFEYGCTFLMSASLDCQNKSLYDPTIKYVIPVKLINNNYGRND